MRLLFVSHSLPPHGRPMDNLGGMQRVAVDLHDSLIAHRDTEVQALVLRTPWNQRHWRTPVFLARAAREIRRLVSAGEVDAILFSSMLTAAIAVPLRRHLARHGVITAAIANGLDVTTPAWPYPWLVRKVFDSLDLVLPISRATAAACLASGLAKEKCEVVHLGIKLDRFSPPADKPDAKARLLGMAGVDGVSPRLVLASVGRLVPRKGVAWFVENVMPALPRDVALVVAGDGPDRGRIEEAVAAGSLSRRVKLLGTITDSQLEMLYHGSDLFVMPNVRVAGDMEGFGLVMLEAGLCGVPVIASNIEGIADVITEGENGHLVESGSADAFAAAVRRYYDLGDALAELSSRARLHTAGRFGWAGVTERYLTVLAEQLRHTTTTPHQM